MFRHHFNSLDISRDDEKTLSPSMTVPNQSLHPRELYSRFVRGLPLVGGRNPIYDEDSPLPDVQRMDFTERQQLAEDISQEIQRIKNDMEEKQNADYVAKVREATLAMEAAKQASAASAVATTPVSASNQDAKT